MAKQDLTTRNAQTNNKYRVDILRLPETSFFVQECPIPQISCDTAPQYTSYNKVNHSSDELEYSPITLTFLLQEGSRNWYDIYIWMHGLTAPQSGIQHAKLANADDLALDGAPYIPWGRKRGGNLYSDMTITTMSSQGNPILKYTFIDCQPTILTGPGLSSTVDSPKYLTFDATFVYDYFKVSTDF